MARDHDDAFASLCRQFRELALGVLEQCYRENGDKTCQLLTYELKNWSDWTCLSLAVIAHHQEFVAHKCCQMILNDLWMGGMAIRRYLNWKVVASILLFPLVLWLEFKSAEELKLQPKTHEEHLATQHEDAADDDDDDDDDENEGDDNEGDEEQTGSSFNNYAHRRLSDGSEAQKRSDNTHDTSIDFILENKHANDQAMEMTTLSTAKSTLSTPVDDPVEIQTEPAKRTDVFTILKDQFSAKTPATSSISITQRFYEFYNAPITKFWYNAIFYLMFLHLFTYTILVRTPARPSVAECIVTIYLASSALDTAREVKESDR